MEKDDRRRLDIGNPTGLCSDSFWGYSSALIAKYQVRWIEAAIVSPCLTTMLVYYVEGDCGHLMGEELGKQHLRTAVHGICCTFQMPWEDIIKCLERTRLDKDVVELPRLGEVMKYVLRAHMNVCGVNWKKTSKQLHVRPYVLLLL